MSLNACHFIGNLTKDPLTTTTQSGITKCTFNIAVQRRQAGQDGVRKADFIPITCWRTLAENCAKYLKKGRKVAVTCHVRTDSYTTDHGENRFTINFEADDVEFLSSANRDGNAQQAASPQAAAPSAPVSGGFIQVDDDELPFDQ